MAGRLNVTLAVKRLVRDVAARLPELAHVRASRLLVVAGEARRASRATIRPYGGAGGAGGGRGPRIEVRGHEVRYVITLRPLWFLDSTPVERIDTILHELYHASLRFDGTLHGARRHARLAPAAYRRRIRTLRRRYLAEAPAELVAPFAHQGLARARMWLERPAGPRRGGGPERRVYTERQLYYGLVRMRTRRRLGQGQP